MPTTPNENAAVLAAVDAFYKAGGAQSVAANDIPSVIEAFRSVVGVLQAHLQPSGSSTTAGGSCSSQPKLLSADQAAEVLGVSNTHVRELWRSGRLEYIKVGRGRKVWMEAIDRFISRSQVDGRN